jgi:arylsulfatase A-like enzyme
MRPDSTKVYDNGSGHLILKDPAKQPTMPLHFKNNGYVTRSSGCGWSEAPWHPPCGWTCYVNFKPEKKKGMSGKGKRMAWRPACEIYDGPDDLHGDHQTVTQAISAMDENREKPFFIAVGLYKPHLPFVAPKRYWDRYDHDKIESVRPADLPVSAVAHMYNWSEIWSYGCSERKLFAEDCPPDRKQSLDLIHAYYAATSFADAQVGRLLAQLNELGLNDRTAVVVWGDHGFHLGDMKRWAKHTQFEGAMRSPLLVRLPGKQKVGVRSSALVETVDLYPTLCDFCGLELPGHLQGESLVPLVSGATTKGKAAAYSQISPVGGPHKHLMAYSLRTDTHRYVEWRDRAQGYKVVASELYQFGDAFAETRNVIGDPKHEKALKRSRALMRVGYESLP